MAFALLAVGYVIITMFTIYVTVVIGVSLLVYIFGL